MKGIKWTLILSLAALVVCGLGGTAFAFHSSGVAECGGCHTMHNSEQGQAVRTGSGSGSFLLRAFTPSDTCLTCHAAYGQFTDNGAGFGSGGDFYWVTKSFTYAGHGAGSSETSEGDRHGHNVISNVKGIVQDQTLATGPGGTYNSAYLGCNSCHDPHGQQHNALLLYGIERTAENYPSGYNFTKAAPTLRSPGRRTASSNKVTNANHTAFGNGMSDWCANCHGAMLNGNSNHVHPVNRQMNSTYVGTYDGYVSTGNLAGGSHTNAYWEKVPFETGTDCTVTLGTMRTSTAGPDTNSKVMCLSCHRSHASAYKYAGRWDFESSDLSQSHPLATDNGATAADAANKDYGYGGVTGTPFVSGQKSLCNKCHAKD
jgi:hypothetical protein